MTTLIFVFFISTLSFVIVDSNKEAWPMATSGSSEIDWTGIWHGAIEAYPDGEMGRGWNKTFEIGHYPVVNNTCTVWRSTFTADGVLQGIKDYRFCRGNGADDLYIDEGGIGTLRVRWINDVLIASFKYSGLFAVSRLRLRDSILEEEVVVTTDEPGVEERVVSMRTNSIHLIKMKRVSSKI